MDILVGILERKNSVFVLFVFYFVYVGLFYEGVFFVYVL